MIGSSKLLDTGSNPTMVASPTFISTATTTCSHCGQLVIGSQERDVKGLIFCCEGCRAIFDWLRASSLDGYYDLMAQSGKKAPQAFIGEDYQGFLKSLETQGTLVGLGRWRGSKHDLALSCSEITCAGCGWLLERILQDEKGVKTFDVDFLHGEAYLEYDSSETSLKKILSILAGFGYRLKPQIQDNAVRPMADKALLYRLAVSGACFANAMAFSFAVYLGAFRGMPKSWIDVFGVLGFCLTLPAVGYAAFPFFSSAKKALLAGRFNIDVTVSVGIVLSFFVTTVSVLRHQGGNFSDSLTGLIFFLLLGRWAVRRFEASLALKGRWFDALRHGKIRVVRQGEVEWIDSTETAEGEIVEVLGGEYAPMDGALLSTEAWMDTSLLTGESRATQLFFGDAVFAGYLNMKGHVTLRTHGNAASTRIANLGAQLDVLVAGRRSIPDGVGSVAKWFTLSVIGCGLVTLIWHWNQGPMFALTAAASVFIISCSCALALAAPISRGLGLKRALNLGFHFRSQMSLEALSGIRCVLFDKTGTLTFTQRTVSSWNWIQPKQGPSYVLSKVLQGIKSLSRRSLHPVAVSLFHALESTPEGSWILSSTREMAHFGLLGTFSDMEWTHTLCICRFGAWDDVEGDFHRLGYAKPHESEIHVQASLAPDSCIFLNGRLIALIGFTDEIKPDVSKMVSNLKAIGVTSVLLSGDNSKKVEQFSRLCGFENVHSSQTPEGKQKWAKHYRETFGPCLAVGDGFNDNLLFGESDLAMAVVGGAVDLSKGTDILFTGARPSDLVSLLHLAGRVKRSIQISFWVSGLYNLIAISIAMRGGVSPLFAAVLMPISSLSLCLVALCVIKQRRIFLPAAES